MDKETQIAQTLKQNVPSSDTAHVMAAPVVGDVPTGQPTDYGLDDITVYKLGQHFGENYKESDIEAKQQLGYIYEDIAQRLNTREYPVVVGKINELRRMLGFNHSENARYKLYQWLKLDQKRTQIEMEQNNLRTAL